MAFVFPAAPTIGQQAVNPATNVTFRWDGAKWTPLSGVLATSWGAITGTLASQNDLNTALNGKQATLVSGVNLRTVNGSTLLGSTDLSVTGGVANTGDTMTGRLVVNLTAAALSDPLQLITTNAQWPRVNFTQGTYVWTIGPETSNSFVIRDNTVGQPRVTIQTNGNLTINNNDTYINGRLQTGSRLRVTPDSPGGWWWLTGTNISPETAAFGVTLNASNQPTAMQVNVPLNINATTQAWGEIALINGANLRVSHGNSPCLVFENTADSMAYSLQASAGQLETYVKVGGNAWRCIHRHTSNGQMLIYSVGVGGGETLRLTAATGTDCKIYFGGPSTAWTIGAQGATANGEFWFWNVTASVAKMKFMPGASGWIHLCQSVVPDANNSYLLGNTGNSWAHIHSYDYVTSSAERDKRDIVAAAAGALAKVRELPVKRFRMSNEDNTTPLRYGFVAGDIHKTMPDVAADDESYSLTQLTAVLWQAVQELAAEVSTLKGAE